MTKDLLHIITPFVTTIQKGINTNNGWGFGGAIKDVYNLNTGYSIHTGKAYYRHLPSTSFTNLRDKEGNIVTEKKKEIIQYINKLNDHDTTRSIPNTGKQSPETIY